MNVARLFLISLILIFSSQYVHASDSSLAAWYGMYEYQGTGGHTVGGSPIWLDAVLTISPSGSCKISEDGYQIEKRIICTVSKNGNGVDILFKSFADGKTENVYGIVVYKPNERLFSLFPKDKTILTDWGSIKPDIVKKNRGVFFKRKTQKK